MKSLLSLDEYIESTIEDIDVQYYTYYIFDNWIPIRSDGYVVPITAFLSDETIGNVTLDLPNNVAIDTFDGQVAFIVKNDNISANEYIDVTIGDFNVIDKFINDIDFPLYTQDQIEKAVVREQYAIIEDDEE